MHTPGRQSFGAQSVPKSWSRVCGIPRCAETVAICVAFGQRRGLARLQRIGWKRIASKAMGKLGRGSISLLLAGLLVVHALLLLLGLGDAYFREKQANTASFGANVLRVGLLRAWHRVFSCQEPGLVPPPAMAILSVAICPVKRVSLKRSRGGTDPADS